MVFVCCCPPALKKRKVETAARTTPRIVEKAHTMELPSPMYLGAGPGSDLTHGLGFNDPAVGGLPLQDMIDSDMKADFDDISNTNFQGLDSLDMLNDLDSFTLLGGTNSTNGTNSLWSQTPHTTTPATSTVSTLHHNNYVSFSNSYLEDMTGSASVMVNPNNVMPIHPVQHQQVSSLSVNTNNAATNGQSSPLTSPMYSHHPQQLTPQGHVHQQQQQIVQQVSYRGQPQAKSVRVLPPVSSPMQQVPSPAQHQPTSTTSSNRKKNQKNSISQQNGDKENGYPKPAYSYSCLIALALKNSHTGSMSVSEIYKFMW